jgi:hypothetical protein
MDKILTGKLSDQLVKIESVISSDIYVVIGGHSDRLGEIWSIFQLGNEILD